MAGSNSGFSGFRARRLIDALVQDDSSSGRRTFELPGAKPHYRPDRPGQVDHIALDLALDFDKQSFGGTCTITLTPVRDGLTTLVLDGVDLTIESVHIDGTDVSYDHDGEKLTVDVAGLESPLLAGTAAMIAIAYHVDNPKRGLYFVGPTKDYPDKPLQAWTQGEDEDSRYWFPCFDYPGQLSSSELRVKVPKGMTAISNGELAEKKTKGKWCTFHWKQTEIHPSYLITLAVGEFVEERDEWRGKPVTYYGTAEQKDGLRLTMGRTPEMLTYLSDIFGYEYPFPKYAQVMVADFIFGGMENTSATLLTDRCVLDERAAIDDYRCESLVMHELTHQWFGDLLVIKHWSQAWVKEGMATYSEVLWLEHTRSAEDAAYYRLGEARSYLAEDQGRYRRPMVTHVYREAIELYDCHIYEKGGCVYHMIRAELGDELFWRAIQHFVNTHAHSCVETVDLLRAIETSTGRNLEFLFDQYVFRGGYPDYKAAYQWNGESNLAKLTITQTQAKDDDDRQNLFDLKIPIGFGTVIGAGEDTGKGKKKKKKAAPTVTVNTMTVRVSDRQQSFYIPLPQKPDFVSFDVGNHWLKTVTLEYPLGELKAQLNHDPDVLGRIYAAGAIAQKGSLEALNVLASSLVNDPFWGVRVEVAKGLAGIPLDGVLDALKPGLKDKDARVRLAVVRGIAKLKTPNAYQVIEPIAKKGDASYSVEAAALSGIGTLAKATAVTAPKPLINGALKILKSALKERSGWNERVRIGAIQGLAALNDSAEALKLVLTYTAAGTPQALRLASIRTLGVISVGQEANQVGMVLDTLSQLTSEEFFLTQMAVVGGLGAMETPKAIAILQGLAESTPDGRVRRRAEEAVRRVQGKVKSSQGLRQLRDELDQLKQLNQTLRSRIEKLEADEETVKK
ncbi:MAG: M1 family aminopeptidase [Cyanobacteria bacterium P01_C01_bin.89]